MDRDREAGASEARDANWGDARTRSLMHHVATDVACRAGFDICAVAVIRPEDRYELVTVAGDHPGGDALIGTGGVMSEVWEAFGEGADHGTFTFIRAEDMSPRTVDLAVESEGVPDIPVPEDDLTWHPLDVLVARVCDEDGETRALVYLSRPQDLRRPDAERIQQITEAVRLPLRSVLTVIEHEELTQHVRLLTLLRRLLHDGLRHDERELVQLVADGVRDAFGAAAVEVQLFGGDWTGPLSPSLGSDLRDALTDAAVRACKTHSVVLIEPGQVWDDAQLAVEETALTDLLRTVEASTIVLTPIGDGGKAIGLMLVARGTRDRRWTDAESAAVVDLGADLGRCILDARAAGRERELLEQLRWHEELRRNFATTIVHEFKTPLTVIRANSELLETESLPEDAHLKLDAIDRSVSRLMSLVVDLATLAKVSDPTREPARGKVDLAAVLQDVTSTLRPVADRARVHLDAPETIPGALVAGDAEELNRALTNLVDNAIKYSAPDSRVQTWLRQGSHGVVFGCRDDGLGISEPDQAALFTPFFRSTNPEALGRPGTGLGLDIVKSIVERHGGAITFESTLGSGSTFRIELPRLDPEPGHASPDDKDD